MTMAAFPVLHINTLFTLAGESQVRGKDAIN
jgi:hypothetical protein